jgi:hypothetical protein
VVGGGVDEDGLGGLQLDDLALPLRCMDVVGDVGDDEAEVEVPADLDDALGVIEEARHGEVEPVQVGAGGQAQGVEDVHGAGWRRRDAGL